MAHESANPKVRLMLAAAFIAAISLALFDQIFRSYYNSMMEEEESEKVLTVAPKQLIDLRAAEQTRLTSAALPIDRAMKELATRGREDPALKTLGKADITPEPSTDTAAVTGWGQLAAKPAEAHVDTQAVPVPNAPYVLADGGPTFDADAGKMPLLADGSTSMIAPLTVEAGTPAPVPAPAPPAPNPHGGH